MGAVRRARPAAGAARRVPRARCRSPQRASAAASRRRAIAVPASIAGAARRSGCRRRRRSAASSAASPPATARSRARIVTTSPDVTVSTNLGAWVNRRGIFDRAERADTFREEKVVSAQRWAMSPQGQHIELGIAEQQSVPAARRARPGRAAVRRAAVADRHALRPVHQARARCAQLCALPGCPLHPGGDAVGHHAGARGRRAPIGRRAADRARRSPGSSAFEPAFADELAVLLRWALRGDPARGRANRSISGCRPDRSSSPSATIDAGPRRGDRRRRLLAARAGAGCRAGDRLLRRGRARGARRVRGDPRGRARRRAARGHLARPAAPRLARGRWRAATSASPSGCWRGCARVPRSSPSPTATRRRCRGSAASRGNAVVPLGVDHFGQSGDIPDLYRAYGIDSDAIIDAAARACLRHARRVRVR